MSVGGDWLRARGGPEHARATTVELFFDLVFVFAVTQLSRTLLANLTTSGVLQSLLLFLAVWWLWISTAWLTNWLDPDRMPVRIMLFALMLGGLMLSTSLPEAMGDRGLLFGCVYAAMQVGRSLFMLAALHGHRPANFRNFVRITLWVTLSASFWIAGGSDEGAARTTLWLVAIAIEYSAPWVYFWVPGLGRSSSADWDIEGTHLTERCGLFVILALGESILVTGATFTELPRDAIHRSAFIVAFLGSVAMWWIYFDTGAERAKSHIIRSDDPGRQARLAYTYIHLVIVAGIIVSAVADELLLRHPEQVDDAGIATILIGPALYVLGNALFKWVTNDRRGPPLSHCVGLALLAALSPIAFAQSLSTLALASATTAILWIVAAWESIALRQPVMRL